MLDRNRSDNKHFIVADSAILRDSSADCGKINVCRGCSSCSDGLIGKRLSVEGEPQWSSPPCLSLRAQPLARHCEPHPMGRGNPAFLLGCLLDCFLDILSGLLRITFRWYRPTHGMGLAIPAQRPALQKPENFWRPL